MLTVHPIPAFTDNYIWCITSDAHPGTAYVVDPGDATPVLDYLTERQLELAGILITHHHPDHVGGVADLTNRFPVPVYGPDNPNIAGLTDRLHEGEAINLFGLELETLEVPGHTLDHIAYYCPTQPAPLLFCGDTLFKAGCGRLFEGTAEQMHASLSKLAALPEKTLVFCTHEYTLANLAFALAVEPDNQALIRHQQHCQDERAHNRVTLPSTIALEKEINPFLRSATRSLKTQVEQHCGSPLESEVAVFRETRRWKDQF